MIVELKSLMPLLEESLQTSSLQLHNAPLQEPLPLPLTEISEELPRFRDAALPSSDPAASGTEGNIIPRLLEELLKSSERNASSAEKIAELLEQQENTFTVHYN